MRVRNERGNIVEEGGKIGWKEKIIIGMERR